MTAHEVGHSIGLRHNFQGSYDSVNFFDEYWEMREENIPAQVQTLNEFYDANAMTEAQIKGNMRGYQYSSIMDYHARFNGDWAGIGKYDEAAILFAYTFGTTIDYEPTDEVELDQSSGFVEIFTDLTEAGADTLRRYDGRVAPTERALLENIHYLTLYNEMGGKDALKARSLMRWDELQPQILAEAPDRPVEVPYMFCSDEIAGALVSCNKWDLGADPLEMVQSASGQLLRLLPTAKLPSRAHQLRSDEPAQPYL